MDKQTDTNKGADIDENILTHTVAANFMMWFLHSACCGFFAVDDQSNCLCIDDLSRAMLQSNGQTVSKKPGKRVMSFSRKDKCISCGMFKADGNSNNPYTYRH